MKEVIAKNFKDAIKHFGKRSDIGKVDLQYLAEEVGFNPRFEFGEIEELCDSIFKVVNGDATTTAEKGLEQPLKGYWDTEMQKFILTDGHRRFRAIKMGAAKGYEVGLVPFVNSSKNELDRAIAVLSTNTQKKLHPMEMAIQLSKIKELGKSKGKKYTLKDLGSLCGISHVSVSNYLKLRELPEDVQQKIKDGDINYTDALKEFNQAVKQAKKEGKDKKQAKEEAANKVTGEKAPKTEKQPKNGEKVISNDLMERMQTVITQIDSFKEQLEAEKAQFAQLLRKAIVMLKNGANANEIVQTLF